MSWTFWVAAVVLGWSACNSWDESFSLEGSYSPGAPILLIIWSAAILVSILVHELGHAMAMRYYGIRSRMILYHFGGLAIGSSFGSWNGARRGSQNALDSLLIAAAGPAAQLALAACVYAIGRFLRYAWNSIGYCRLLRDHTPITPVPTSAATYAMFNSLINQRVVGFAQPTSNPTHGWR